MLTLCEACEGEVACESVPQHGDHGGADGQVHHGAPALGRRVLQRVVHQETVVVAYISCIKTNILKEIYSKRI